MAKYIPFSLVLVTVVLASFMASKPRPKPALRKMIILMAIYVAVWAYLCLNVYPSKVFIE
jgi:UDP-N-acetylmuramyl pentapeptide phosphotransferase/UDP-N-acetylglucosamine-1-phosphate transferase